MSGLTWGSLFTGVGGFDLGLERSGHRVLWQVEKDAQCRTVLRRHFPHAAIHEDVRHVGAANLPRVDGICGGFPCQDLSVAGRRRGLAGERSGLFFEFMRLLGELAPRWVLIENVPGLLSSNGGRDMGTVLGTLGQLGYGWTYRVLDSQYFGLAQRRARVFIVGCAGGFCPPEVLLEPESVSGDTPPRREAREGATPLLEVGARSKSGGREGCGIGDPGDPMFTLQSGHQHGVASAADRLAEMGAYEDAAYKSLARDERWMDERAFAFRKAQKAHSPDDGERWEEAETSGTLGAHSPTTGHVVAHTLRAEGCDASEDGTGRGVPLVVSESGKGFWSEGVGPLRADPGGMPSHVAFGWANSPSQGMEVRDLPDALRSSPGGMPAVYSIGGHAGAADGEASNRSHANGGPAGMGIQEGLSHSLRQGRAQNIVAAHPRRLTPTECERLQGFPDGWTAWGVDESGERVEVRLGVVRGELTERQMADTPRYRMMGNAVSVNVAEWIGSRIGSPLLPSETPLEPR